MDISYVIILFVIPFFILNYFIQKSGKEFIEVYQQKKNKNDYLNPTQYIQKYHNKPIEQMKDAPYMIWMSYGILWKDYHDKQLNTAAHRVRNYSIATVLLMIINFMVFSYFITH